MANLNGKEVVRLQGETLVEGEMTEDFDIVQRIRGNKGERRKKSSFIMSGQMANWLGKIAQQVP